ncbi:MAG: ABC transporter permease [Gemmatimonadales bacterium]|nr:ABC transporter permease [Gemmatimonadales bacterium]
MSLLAEARGAVRHLRHDLTFTIAAGLVLALGIGAATAAFAVVRGVLLRPLPFPAADRLVTLCDRHPSVRDFCVVTPPDAAEWAERSTTLVGIGLARDWGFRLRQGDETVGIRGGLATPSLFQTLRAPTALGRTFAADEQSPAPARVAVLSHALWRSRFSGDSTVLGTDLVLDGQRYRVIGVLAPEARIPHLEAVDLWLPLPFDPRDEANRAWRGFQAIGRLAPGVSRSAAESELDRLETEIAARFPDSHQGAGVRVGSLHDSVVGRARPMLLLFLGSVLVVLAIGCGNLANLALARGLERQTEFSLRLALGGDRPTLVRMLVLEQLGMAGIGGLLGVALGGALVRAFVAAAPATLPRLDAIRLDPLVVVFALVVTSVAGLVAAVIPVLRTARVDPAAALVGAGRVSGPANRGFRQGLVVGQVALATTLAIGAGLLGRSLARLAAWDPGFPRADLAVMWTSISPERVTEAGRLDEVYRRALDGVRGVAGVTAAAMVSNGPLFGGRETGEFLPAGADPNGARLTATWFDAGPRYFATLGIPLAAGRDFDAGDRAGGPAVAIVNETLARRLWPGAAAVGQAVVRTADGARLEVVGVVRDVPPADPAEPTVPEVYWPFAQSPRWASYLVVRGTASAAAIADRLAEVAPEIDPGRLVPYRETEARLRAAPRFNLSLSAGFALVALVLALVGVYGVMAFAVVSRRRELGVRLAVGASPGSIRRMVLAEASRLAVGGVGLGVVGGLALGRGIGSALIGVEPGDPGTVAVVALSLVGAAVLAAGIPALRAGRVDPAGMLRTD